jgi:hypothetical protein
MQLETNPAVQSAIESTVPCGKCDGCYFVVLDKNLALCPVCDTEVIHYDASYFLKPFREAGL